MIKINVGSSSRTFNATLFQFYSNYHYTINLDDDNKLNATRHGDLVVVHFDKRFGEISSFEVNAEEHKDCVLGCSLIANKNNSLVLQAFNIWEGRAYAGFELVEEEVQSNIDLTQLATAFAVLLGAFILARVVARFGEKAN